LTEILAELHALNFKDVGLDGFGKVCTISCFGRARGGTKYIGKKVQWYFISLIHGSVAAWWYCGCSFFFLTFVSSVIRLETTQRDN
jgi:hypothetical protein